jgi:hypothetical protein
VRRWAALLAAGALAGCGGGGENPAGGPPAPEAPRAQRAATTPPPPPLSAGTAVAPLAVDLAASRDPVTLGFKRPPAAGLLFDLDTGRVLWRREPRRVRPMASLTKMMTALVVVDRIGRRGSAKVTPNALNYAGSGVGCSRRTGGSASTCCSTACCWCPATTPRACSPSVRAGGASTGSCGS